MLPGQQTEQLSTLEWGEYGTSKTFPTATSDYRTAIFGVDKNCPANRPSSFSTLEWREYGTSKTAPPPRATIGRLFASNKKLPGQQTEQHSTLE